MTPRAKSILIVTGILVAVIVILLLIASRVIQQGFSQLETLDTEAQIQRAQDALGNELSELESKTRAWAASDAAYNYVSGQNPGYLETNIFPATIANLRINLLMYTDGAGQAVTFKTFLLPEGLETVAPPLVREALLNEHNLFSTDPKSPAVRGIMYIDGHAILVSSSRVTPNNPQALSNGYLIFGRYLDQNEIQRLADVTNLLLEIHPLSGTLPADIAAVKDQLLKHDVVVKALDDKTVAGYTLLPDLQGNPQLVLRVQMLREIYQRGQNTFRFFQIALILISVFLGWLGQSMLEKLMVSQQTSLATMGRYQAVAEQISEGMVQIDAHSKVILEANPSFANLLGSSAAGMIGQTLEEIHIQKPDELEQDLGRMLTEDQQMLGERQYYRADGLLVDVEVSSARIMDQGREVLCIVVRDVTARKQAETNLMESEQRYHLAAQGANDGLWDWNLRTNELYLSERWKSMLGYRENEIGANPDEWFNLVHAEDINGLQAQLDAHLRGTTSNFQSEHRVRHQDGTYRWMLSRGLALRDESGKPYRMAGSQTDITERKQSEEQFRHDALHDALTNLPNRSLFIDRLSQSITRSKRRPDYLFAVLFLDFDRFKVINDSLGHTTGDQLLIAGARRMEDCLRSMDTIARLGGDEFVILLEYIESARDAVLVAERIQEALRPAFNLGGHEVFISASIGVVLSTIGYDRAEDALRDADIAMYRSKAMGRARYELFNPDLRSIAMARLELETDLRRAIERQEFIVHYQPILSLRTGAISGFEALIRWQHPTLGTIWPAEFIPVAEETGLIIPIGYWVLQEACRQMREWQRLLPNHAPLTISVNMSGKQFSQLDLPDKISQILQTTGLDISCLRLEITESVVMETIELTTSMLKRLKTMGLQLEIDDFGTGYSSLSYLQHLPIDAIKIDRSFINEMNLGGSNHGIVQAIIALAHNLGMHVIAEGVEMDDQLIRLKSMQCELAQGFLFHQPMSGQDVKLLLTGKPKDENEPL